VTGDAAAHEPRPPVPRDGDRDDVRTRVGAGGLRPLLAPGRPPDPRGRLPARGRAHPPAAALPVEADRGPVRARSSLLDPGPRLRSRLPHPRDGRPAARRPRAARHAGRTHLLPASGPGASAVGAVPDPRDRRRQGRADDEDPPLRGRRGVGGGGPLRAARRLPRRAGGGAARARLRRGRAASGGPRDARAGAGRGAAPAAARPACLPGTVANLDSATLRWAPGAGTLARAAREIARFVPGVDAGDGSVLDMPSVQAPRTRSTARSRRTGASRWVRSRWGRSRR